MVKANVDRMLEALRERKTISLPDLSRKLALPKEDIQKSAEYLEEDGIIKIDYNFTTPTYTLIKDPEMAKPSQPPSPEQQTVRRQASPNNGLENGFSQQSAQPINDTPISFDQQPQQPAPYPSYQQGGIQITQDQMSQYGQQSGQNPNAPTVQLNINIASQPGTGTPAGQDSQEKYPFLISEQPQQKAEPAREQAMAPSEGILTAPKQSIPKPERIPDEDPLNPDRPRFDFSAPTPADAAKVQRKTSAVLDYTDEFSPVREYNFPSYVESKIDKMEYLIDMLNKKITEQDFRELNVLYRKIYEIYRDSDDLSPNEKYLVGEKIVDLFERIKRIYLIEGIA